MRLDGRSLWPSIEMFRLDSGGVGRMYFCFRDDSFGFNPAFLAVFINVRLANPLKRETVCLISRKQEALKGATWCLHGKDP